MPDPTPDAKSVVQEPTVSKAPPAGRKFPCPACGARLDYDPTARGLKCPYCGFQEAITRDDAAEVVARDYLDYLDKEEANGTAIPGRSSQTRCTGCGAVVLLEDHVATDRCPFCGTHLENQPEAAAALIPPESLLPFAVDLHAARDAFSRWLGSLWFAPMELKAVANLGQLTGVYLPFWTYDAMTVTFYDGQRGEDYLDTEVYTEIKPDGSTETKARAVTRTRWRPASGEVRHFFDDVLVCGSTSLPAGLVADLGAWDLPRLEPFGPDYLSGFKTERYAVGLKEGFQRAKGLMEPEVVTLVRRDIGGDHQQISGKKTRYSAVTFKHLLLPAWVAAYRYRDRAFQVLVNGRTAKVAGDRPYSWAKIAGLVLAVAAAAAAVTGLILYSQR